MSDIANKIDEILSMNEKDVIAEATLELKENVKGSSVLMNFLPTFFDEHDVLSVFCLGMLVGELEVKLRVTEVFLEC
jgi:hypothetical protein